MTLAALLPWVFAALAAGGLSALGIVLVWQFPNLHGAPSAQRQTVGMRLVIAGFTAAFGLASLTTTLIGWPPAYSILLAFAFALIFARLTFAVVRVALRQMPPPPGQLVGVTGVVRDKIAGESAGQVKLDTTPPLLYPARADDRATTLCTGETIYVIGVESDHLLVARQFTLETYAAQSRTADL